MPKISIIQILQKEDADYEKIIQSNYKFLEKINVEYIVFDTLENFSVLKFIKQFPKQKYFRKKFENTKKEMLESAAFATGEKIFFLKSEDLLTLENVESLEKARPNIYKKDINKIKRIKKDNFRYDDFNLLVKENKTLWEKIKLLF